MAIFSVAERQGERAHLIQWSLYVAMYVACYFVDLFGVQGKWALRITADILRVLRLIVRPTAAPAGVSRVCVIGLFCNEIAVPANRWHA